VRRGNLEVRLALACNIGLLGVVVQVVHQLKRDVPRKRCLQHFQLLSELCSELVSGLFELEQVLHPCPRVALVDLRNSRQVVVREHPHRLRDVVDHCVGAEEGLVVVVRGILERRAAAGQLRQLVAGSDRGVEDGLQHGEDVLLCRGRVLLRGERRGAEEVVDP
jgi:hypothetical protein